MSKITTETLEPQGFSESWAGGIMLDRKPIIYSTSIYSVDGESVSQWGQVDATYFGYEACDYFTGVIYHTLDKLTAQRLAEQLAQSYAYVILTSASAEGETN